MQCDKGFVRLFFQTEVTTNWSLSGWQASMRSVPHARTAGQKLCRHLPWWDRHGRCTRTSCHLYLHLICLEYFLHCQLKIRKRSWHPFARAVFCSVLFVKLSWSPKDVVSCCCYILTAWNRNLRKDAVWPYCILFPALTDTRNWCVWFWCTNLSALETKGKASGAFSIYQITEGT